MQSTMPNSACLNARLEYHLNRGFSAGRANHTHEKNVRTLKINYHRTELQPYCSQLRSDGSAHIAEINSQ